MTGVTKASSTTRASCHGLRVARTA